MNAVRVEATVMTDGELHLKDLPFHRGDKVEAIVTAQPVQKGDRDKVRALALDQFLALARSSSFRSTGPYPSRDELHARP
jgi:hypothetical protein